MSMSLAQTTIWTSPTIHSESCAIHNLQRSTINEQICMQENMKAWETWHDLHVIFIFVNSNLFGPLLRTSSSNLVESEVRWSRHFLSMNILNFNGQGPSS